MSSQPDILVTGSAGHLGYALMLELPKNGYCPIGIDIKESDKTTIVGSISDRALIRSIFDKHPTLRYVLHTATLHKPHVGSHSKADFVETNITGTLVLLEEASRTNRIEAFIFASTTSTFGAALAPARGQPAAWIDEAVVPIPKNIYGATKVAAEDICQLVHNDTKMPVLVLKISRFFPEEDDNEASRLAFSDDNLKVCELLYRRVDIADVVTAHICAMKRARTIKWGKYIISATPPFQRDVRTLQGLGDNAEAVLQEVCPKDVEIIKKVGWKLLDRLDRVYDSSKATRELGWTPEFIFQRAVEQVGRGDDWRSELTHIVGKRGYHAVPTGVYTVG